MRACLSAPWMMIFPGQDEAEKKKLADYLFRNYYDIKNHTYEICGV